MLRQFGKTPAGTRAAPPASLSRRFAIAAAILTACAVLLISIVSFWLIDRQREQANALLQQREVAFHATTVGTNLGALTTRLADVANSPILANALVDSAGKETYLRPYLHGLRQINGIPLQLMFTDFEGVAIADNGAASFSADDVAWLRRRIDSGDERAALRAGPQGQELIGVNLLRYSRTRTPEGALVYKVRLADLKPVQWAAFRHLGAAGHAHEIDAAVPLPPGLRHLGLVLHEDERRLAAPMVGPGPQYLAILAITALLALVVFLLASRLAHGLTGDLRRLEAFSGRLGDGRTGSGDAQRAPLAGSREVVSLAGAINRMLDRLYEQHARLETERRRFLQLSNNIPQLVWMADADGTITWFNQRWYEFTGAAPGTLAPHDWREFHDPAILPQVAQRWKEALASGNTAQMTFPLRGADGAYRSIFASVAPLRDAGGRIVQWFGTGTDVSELERAESALRYSEDRLRQGLVAAHMAVWERDPGTGAVSFSANLHSVFGKDWHNVSEVWELYHPDDRQMVLDCHAQVMRDGGSYHLTPRILRADDGGVAWIDLRGHLGPGIDGRTVVHAVAIDVTERKRAEEALRLADRRKDEFLAMLAHELRNPLAPIASAADMLRIAYAQEARIKQISEIVARQVAHMRHLVDDLLDVSRVTRGLVTVARKPLDLGRVLNEAVEQSRPLVDARRHVLSVEPASGPLMVDGDHTRLVQVVANLVTNAAKYTPEGGRIDVTLAARDGQAVLSVHDNGSGIGPDLLPVVFDLFTQGTRTLDRAQGGLGLGLALVRKLVELHGGTVTAACPGPGQGSTFTVRLALLPA
jgi:PAS domain S-box-containing protein